MSAATGTVDDPRPRPRTRSATWRGATPGRSGCRASWSLLLVFTKLIQPSYGVSGVQGLAISVLPLALAAVAQAIVVISGGIDLSIGAMMALTSVVAAILMKGQPEEFGVVVVIGVLLLGLVIGADQRQAGRRHPRARHRRDPGDVVRLGRLRAARAQDARRRLGDLAQGPGLRVAAQRMDPEGCGRPARDRRRRSGSRSDGRGSACPSTPSGATGWRRSAVACRSVERRSSPTADRPVRRTRRPGLTASTGIATPVPGPYTLLSVAAVVLGGVSLAGGRGGVFGPIVAVVILQLIRTDMTFLNVNTNLAIVLQGVILIGVVMVGSLIQIRRSRA